MTPLRGAIIGALGMALAFGFCWGLVALSVVISKLPIVERALALLGLLMVAGAALGAAIGVFVARAGRP